MTTNHFAHHIGLKNGENLYQIKRGNNKISRRLAEAIVEAFPEVSEAWLLAGDGEMFTPRSQCGVELPFYDVDLESSITAVDSLIPSSTMRLPSSIEADFAMVYRGDQMLPSIPPNTVVVLRMVELKQLVYGKEYLVVSPSIVTLRCVRAPLVAATESQMLRLVAANGASYDDVEIERAAVEALYRVVAKLVISY